MSSGIRRASLAVACAAAADAALANAGGAAGVAMLDAWQPLLGREPAWIAARARASRHCGADRDALRLLIAALRRRPRALCCWRELAATLAGLGRWDAARRAWLEVARLDPAAAAPWNAIAALELLQARPAAARTAWFEALRRDPADAEACRAVRSCLDPRAAERFIAVASAAAVRRRFVAAIPPAGV